MGPLIITVSHIKWAHTPNDIIPGIPMDSEETVLSVAFDAVPKDSNYFPS